MLVLEKRRWRRACIQIFNGESHEFFEDVIIYSLDIATVLAGAKFRGDFEQRLKGILESVVKSKKEGKEIILFIDEIHTIMGAGATGVAQWTPQTF